MRALARSCSSWRWSGLVLAGYAAYRIWDQGTRDEQRPADAIVVMGAAQYDGRPSPSVRGPPRPRDRPVPRRASRRTLIVTGGKQRGRSNDRGRECPRLRDRPWRAGGGDPRRGQQPDDARVDPRRRQPDARRGPRRRPSSCPIRAHAARAADGLRRRDRGLRIADARPARWSATRSSASTRSSTSSARSRSTSCRGESP